MIIIAHRDVATAMWSGSLAHVWIEAYTSIVYYNKNSSSISKKRMKGCARAKDVAWSLTPHDIQHVDFGALPVCPALSQTEVSKVNIMKEDNSSSLLGIDTLD